MKHFEIMYNLGVQFLINGNPDIAFKLFQGSSFFYYKQSKIWLRLAECCIAIYMKQVNDNIRCIKINKKIL